ncbi:hypothetical protein PV08_11659 [Exophiala spinifera]|uniref:Amine oxidase n=1 Tax=Exophiala spinifera TaxID=91928 RepID=A0A0D2AW42_9EURO|nr:uncharacterized protein PV08_11659 [Exophiala spinifera]KIW10695.1 hypothetical protein PV08_11659 [Exophiala spinifera]
MQSIARGIASELVPGTLHLSSPVVSIEQLAPDSCTVSTAAGKVSRCRKVIVPVPTPLLSSIKFSPHLPEAKATLSASTALGYYSKMIYVFDHPWWRDAGLSGVFESVTGPVSFTRDTSIPADGQWSISCFIVGEPGRRWSQLPDVLGRQRIWEQFSRAFGSVVASVPQPVNVIKMEWTKEAWFGGAPSPVMGPGILSTVGHALKTPCGDVHFVGTETADVWKGYMEGAVRSGRRGAREVIAALREATVQQPSR